MKQEAVGAQMKFGIWRDTKQKILDVRGIKRLVVLGNKFYKR